MEMKAHEIPFTEVTIRTIYLDENDSSHFNPLKDSIKIYRTIFAFVASSFISSLLDLVLFFLLISLLTYFAPENRWNVFAATAVARVCSSLCNYLLNSKKVFGSQNKTSPIRYYLLCVLQFAASAGLVSLAAFLLHAGNIGKTAIKAVIDTLLFLISYQIQRDWVFKK